MLRRKFNHQVLVKVLEPKQFLLLKGNYHLRFQNLDFNDNWGAFPRYKFSFWNQEQICSFISFLHIPYFVVENWQKVRNFINFDCIWEFIRCTQSLSQESNCLKYKLLLNFSLWMCLFLLQGTPHILSLLFLLNDLLSYLQINLGNDEIKHANKLWTAVFRHKWQLIT